MALPPTIPTSFVPHPATAPRRFRADLTGAFGFFSYGIVGVVFVLALGVFLYGRILAAEKARTDQSLAEAQAAIDPKTVEDFIRLRDRLTTSENLLNAHAAFSGFFAAVEKIIPATVRLSTLRLSLDDTGAAKLQGGGLAKSFNALAAASAAFAADGRIRDAIFSSLVVNKDSSVSFSLSATLDRDIITFSP